MFMVQETLEELSKIVIGHEIETNVLNFYASKGFYFECEDGGVVKVGYEATRD